MPAGPKGYVGPWGGHFIRHPDGARMIAMDGGGTTRIFDPSTGEVSREWANVEAGATSATLSSDGSRLLIGGQKKLTLWDTESGALLKTFSSGRRPLRDAALLGDGERAFTSSSGDEVKLWDLTKKKPKARKLDLGGVALSRFALLPAGDRVVADCDDGVLRVVSVETGEVIDELGPVEDRQVVDAFGLSDDGSLLYMGGTDQALRIWKI